VKTKRRKADPIEEFHGEALEDFHDVAIRDHSETATTKAFGRQPSTIDGIMFSNIIARFKMKIIKEYGISHDYIEPLIGVNNYTRKPTSVTAIQFDGENYHDCEVFIGKDNYDNTLNYPNVKTLEGTMEVSVSDYILKGIEGEFYPCKESIFNKSYEVNK